MNMKKHIARIASSLAMVGAVTVGGLALGAAPASAAEDGDLVIKNGGILSFDVCQNAASDSVCASGIASLGQGQDSKSQHGWVDADMVRVPAGCLAQRLTALGEWSDMTYGPAWKKMSGFFGITETVRLQCDG